MAPEPGYIAKVGKPRKALISGRTLATEMDSIAEANPFDSSIVDLMRIPNKLHKSSKMKPGDLRPKTIRRRSRTVVPTLLVNGTVTNRVALEPNHMHKVSKFTNAFISGRTLESDREPMAEADPLGDSIVVGNNQAIRKNSDGVTYNNNQTMNIQVRPRLTSIKTQGIFKKNTPKDEDKE